MRYLITGLILTITMPAVTSAENTAVGIGMVNYVAAELFLYPFIDGQLDDPTYWDKAALEIFTSTVVAAAGSVALNSLEGEVKPDKIEDRLIGVGLSAGVDLAVRTVWYIFK